jgi:hypothetical protein
MGERKVGDGERERVSVCVCARARVGKKEKKGGREERARGMEE